jgi:predicted RNA-binding protein (virulence factor B family)
LAAFGVYLHKKPLMSDSKIKVGEYNELKVARAFDFGLYLGEGKDVVLLPKRFVPPGAEPGDMLNVFVYHDSEDRLIATTQRPKGIVGDIVYLPVVSVTAQGAFMDWGLMKDLFVPKSKQLMGMRVAGYYFVRIYVDERTGRIAASEKIESYLNNEQLTVKELEPVDLLVYRRTDIGYVVIINNRHSGVLHFNDIYHDIQVGDRLQGYIKNIREQNKIDVGTGKPGYQRVEDEAGKVMRLLKENDGYLPYNDKSSPEDIHSFFGISKKTFKMTTGNLYKNRKIVFTPTGIKLAEG